MNQILVPLGILVVLAIVSPLLRVLIAAVAGKQVGQAALAKLPDTIHLAPAGADAWKNGATADAMSHKLEACGFTDAGAFTVAPLKVTLRLLANREASCYAAVYEHPRAGVWCEIFTRYADGTSATFSTNPPHGMAPRPGHLTVHLPGTEVSKLFERARAQRPKGVFGPHEASRVASDFEAAYAESMAWRKGHGVSTREVVNVALRKSA